ncbi:MAG: hypothetical protein IPJ30_10435 [Acidobacteria bacterium]|nr:hypothetical protein [Acidobacteriota bacterium]
MDFGLPPTVDRPNLFAANPKSEIQNPKLKGSQGNVISRRDFKPFGEEISSNTGERTITAKYGTADNLRQKFTTYQRDEESGLDFAEARMYQNRHGRFTAVDPLLASGKSANPQTFNLFVYVTNRPTSLTDPSGLCPPEEQPCMTDADGNEIPGFYSNGEYVYCLGGPCPSLSEKDVGGTSARRHGVDFSPTSLQTMFVDPKTRQPYKCSTITGCPDPTILPGSMLSTPIKIFGGFFDRMLGRVFPSLAPCRRTNLC